MRTKLSIFSLLWLLSYILFYEVRVVSALIVSPWAPGVSFWKPGFFILWVALGILKINGKDTLSRLFLVPILSSLLITIFPFIFLETEFLSRLLSFDGSLISVHSLLHSHTVKLPVGLLKDAISLNTYADSGKPWRDFVHPGLVLLHVVGILIGMRVILSLSFKSPLALFGGFGLALSLFDGGSLAPYAIAGLILVVIPKYSLLVTLICTPLAFYFSWFEAFVIFLSSTLAIINFRPLLIIAAFLLYSRTDWTLRPFKNIPAGTQVYFIDPKTLELKALVTENNASYMSLVKPYPPFWNLLEADSVSCNKNAGFSSKSTLLRPEGVSGKSELEFGSIEIDRGQILSSFKGCIPNDYEQATLIHLRNLGFTKGVLMLSN